MKRSLALAFDLPTNQWHTYRTYSRRQLWTIEIQVVGWEPHMLDDTGQPRDGTAVDASTTLRARQPCFLGDLLETAKAQLRELAQSMPVIESGTLKAYRRG